MIQLHTLSNNELRSVVEHASGLLAEPAYTLMMALLDRIPKGDSRRHPQEAFPPRNIAGHFHPGVQT